MRPDGEERGGLRGSAPYTALPCSEPPSNPPALGPGGRRGHTRSSSSRKRNRARKPAGVTDTRFLRAARLRPDFDGVPRRGSPQRGGEHPSPDGLATASASVGQPLASASCCRQRLAGSPPHASTEQSSTSIARPRASFGVVDLRTRAPAVARADERAQAGAVHPRPAARPRPWRYRQESVRKLLRAFGLVRELYQVSPAHHSRARRDVARFL